MAFEFRSGRRYFYLSERRGDRVKKVYVGGGAAGQIAHEYLVEQRNERREIQDAERALLVQLTQVEALLERSDATIHTLASADLVARGFYLHAQSEWRCRR